MTQSLQTLSFLTDLSESEQETISGGYSFSYSSGGSSFFTDGSGKTVSLTNDNGKSIALVDGKQVDLATAQATFNQRSNEFFSNFRFPTGFSFNFS